MDEVIASLPAMHADVLTALAVSDAPLSFGQLLAAVAKVRGDAAPPSVERLTQVLGDLQHAALAVREHRIVAAPAAGERVRRHLLRAGRFAAVDGRIFGGEGGDRHWSLTDTGLRREFRRALYSADEARYGRCLVVCEHVMRSPPEVLPWVSRPVEVGLILSLPRSMCTSLLFDALDRSFLEMGTREPWLEMATAVSSAAPEHREARDILGALRSRTGEFAQCSASPDGASSWLEHRRDGFGELAAGRVGSAVKRYATSLTALRRSLGRSANPLFRLDGWLLPLAYLLGGNKAQGRAVASILSRAEESAVLGRAIPPELPAAYRRLSRVLAGETAPPCALAGHPLALLIGGLAEHWSGAAPSTAVLESGADQAQAAGFDWLAAELRALGQRDPSLASPGCVALMSHRDVQPQWSRQLGSLEELLQLPSSAGRPAPRSPRLVWMLHRDEDWVHLDLVVQSPRGADGWTKGRVIGLGKLGSGEVDHLSDADRRVARALKVGREGGRYGRSRDTFEWPWDATWLALVGHPAVFLARERARRVDIVPVQPRLVVRKSPRGVMLVVEPELQKGQRLQATWVADDRVEVMQLDETQREVFRVVGAGLSVPAGSRDRVGELIRGLADRFIVADDGAASVGVVDVVDVDRQLIVQLAAVGPGLRAELKIRPLGPGGPVVVPGTGPRAMVAPVDGRVVRGERDLGAERAACAALFLRCPLMAGIPGEPVTLESPDLALDLLESLGVAGDAVRLEWPEGESLRVRGSVGGGAFSFRIDTRDDWFQVNGHLEVDGDLVLDLRRLLELIDDSPARFIQLGPGEFLALSTSLREQLRRLHDVSEPCADGRRVHRLAAGSLSDLVQSAGQTQVVQAWRDQLHRHAAPVVAVDPPLTLRATLRPYQADGYAWLLRVAALGAGALLADDMGLGKTLQALALLLKRVSVGPALVVAPTSVVGGWLVEVWRFAPTLRVHRFGSGDRAALVGSLGPGDLLVSSYGLLVSEAERLSAVRWGTVVLDEAQAIKNPSTRRHTAALGLKAGFRVALTGTPIENHLGELWALFQFLNPGLLGRRQRFSKRFSEPIAAGERTPQAILRKLVLPFLLRRTKSDVLEDLPPRTDIVLGVDPGPEESALYEALRQRAVNALEVPAGGPKPLQVLAWLTRLRLAACNPRLAVDGDIAAPSAKLAAFGELVHGLRENGHRALVFSQFVKHLALLREWLDAAGIAYQYLDGGTPALQRTQRVQAFQRGQGQLFLISLKAGGTGLNLTGADYVVHMDPWWNPAVEDQASDRAHRIGQDRPVTVYRLVTRGTVEERIVALHHHKRGLADKLLADADQAGRLSAAELMGLIRAGGSW